MRFVLKGWLALMIGTTVLPSCSQANLEVDTSSNQSVEQVNEGQAVPSSESAELESETRVFAEVGHKYLTGLAAVEVMDCLINNFLNGRIVVEYPDYFERDQEQLAGDIITLENVLRNELVELGYDGEESLQSITPETVLAKLVLTNSAIESEILAAKGKVEGGCNSAISEAYSKFESASKVEAQ